MFGGIDLKNPPGPNADLYSFEIGASEVIWAVMQPAEGSPVPPARWRHTATALPDGSLFVFGGFRSSSSRLNDGWVFSPAKGAWALASVPVAAEANETERFSVARPKKADHHHKHHKGEEEEKKGESAPASKKESALAGGAVGTITPGSGSNFLEDFGVPLDDPSPHDSNPDAPSPRGAHSAVLIGDVVYVFGGYGGTGYGRRDFNDVYRYSAAAHAWLPRVENAEGPVPDPRSGHCAVAVRSNMLVFGGWSGTGSHGDCWSFDTLANAWAQVDVGGLPAPRWNAAAVSVTNVPEWQVFVFGGSGSAEVGGGGGGGEKGDGGFLSDTLILDSGSMKWCDLGALVAGTVQGPGDFSAAAPLPGDAPRPRADHSLVYDAERKRLVVFGGWANRWYGDATALNVAQVVGPPYAIMGAAPALGPIIGGQKLLVKGLGFEPGKPATVRFTMGRKFVEAVGTALSAEELEVVTPSFEHVAPGSVDLRVLLNGGLLSITTQPYSFFLVTDSANCFSFGPGLLSGLPINTPVSFSVQARDTSNADRGTGQDDFAVKVLRMPESVTAEDARGAELKLPKGAVAEELPGVTVKDEGNGRYTVSYVAPEPGVYRVEVALAGTRPNKDGETVAVHAGAVRGSPFVVTFVDVAAAQKDAEKVNGPVMWAHLNTTLLETFSALAKHTLDGVTKETPPDTPLDVLLSVKNHLTAITQRDTDVKLALDVATASLASMKTEAGKNAALLKECKAAAEKLEKTKENWERALKEAPKCRATIAPLVKKFSAETKKDIEAFEAATVEYAKVIDEKPAYWKFDSGVEAAMGAIASVVADHHSYLRKVGGFAQMAGTFEFPQLLNETNRICKAITEETEEMKRLWALAQEMQTFAESSRAILWSELKPEDLEETAKGIQKRVTVGGTRKTKASHTFKGLAKSIRDFLSTIPLVGSLRHKSMRPRHWALLAKATKKEFTPPHEDPAMKLQGLLDLNLHEFTADVEEITDQAIKEEKMEDTLVKLKETWAAVVFLADPYKAGSDVMLLKIGEEDFESLEGDQLAVQGMMASRYLATFEVEITTWQKELVTVSDVLINLTEIQRKWSYLEPLFIGSDEVRRELPEDASRFEGLDRSVKTILKEMHATMNVKAACNKAGLTKELDDLQVGLDKCEKSLADFLAGKQRQFPRFYFVSKSDLLDILSNGSQPRKILVHTTKVFLQTDTLFLEGGEDGLARPTAMGWKSGVGVEDVAFMPPVPLEGKVEIYLQTVKDAQESALAQLLVRSLARRERQMESRVKWLINREDNGKPSDPAQLSLLVSGMEYVRNVETGFDKIAAGNSNGLVEAEKVSVDDLADLVRLTQTNLSKADRTRVMCMITLDAHGRDIIQKMILEKVTMKKEFQWQSQLSAHDGQWEGPAGGHHLCSGRKVRVLV